MLQPKPPWSPLVPPQISTQFSSNMRRTNSEFLHLAGVLWEITPLWICVDHVNILSSHWWCFSWGTYPDADVTAACLGRSTPKEFQSTAHNNEQHAVQSLQPTTSSYAQWDPGGLDFAEPVKNRHRLGGKPVVKEEGMSATTQPAHQERPTHGPGPSRTSKSYQLYIYRGHQRASHPGLDQANGTVASSFPYLLYFLLPPSQIPLYQTLIPQ